MSEERSKTWGNVAQWSAIAITVGSLIAGGIFGMGMYRADMDYLKETVSKINPVAEVVVKLKSDLENFQGTQAVSTTRYEVFKDKTEDRLTSLEALIPVVKEQLGEIKNDIKELKGRRQADNLEEFR